MISRSRFRWVLVRRALAHKRGKAILIVLAVAMGASVVTALLNLEMDLRSRMNKELRDYGPNVLIVPASEEIKLTQGILKQLDLGKTKERILAWTPQIFIPARALDHSFLITGVHLVSLRKMYPGWDWPVVKEDSVLAGSQLARRLRVKEGSELEVEMEGRMTRLRVDGIFESGEEQDDQLLVSLKKAYAISGRSGEIDVVAISAMGEMAEVEQAFASAIHAVPEVRYRLVRKIAAAETLILDRISRLMALIIMVILITLFFCIHTTVSAILLSRRQEIALVRALGARRKQIMEGLTLELLVLAVVGALSGFLLGMVMAQILGQILFHTWILPRWHVFLITVFSSLAMMVVSSFFPIRRAINEQAAMILKEI